MYTSDSTLLYVTKNPQNQGGCIMKNDQILPVPLRSFQVNIGNT